MKIVKTQNSNPDSTIYLGIDHLKPGLYQLKITLGKEVVQTIQLSKK